MSRPVSIRETVAVQGPFRIVRRGGRKEMVMPVGAALHRAQPDRTVVKAAFRWQRMLESGEFATIGDLAAHEQVATSSMTRIMRLTLLAPEIVERILDGRCGKMSLSDLLEPFPMEWTIRS